MKAKIVDTVMAGVARVVRLEGTRSIMFDRYAGDNSTKLLWTQKVYLLPGTSYLCLPATNIMSFLSSHNTNSAPKRLRDAKRYKSIANACLSFVTISGPLDYPDFIPLLRGTDRVEIGDLGQNEFDTKSGLYLHRSVARLKNGIPNPKERPVLPPPWAVEFSLTISPNREIKEQEVRNLFEEGGSAIGLGTFRGVFGKFMISKWE